MEKSAKQKTIDDLNERLYNRLQTRLDRLVEINKKKKALGDKVKPIQEEIYDLQAEEKEIREELAKIQIKEGLEKARLHFDNALLEMTSPRDSIKVVNEEKIPSEFRPMVPVLQKGAILTAWRAWDGTKAAFYRKVPGIKVVKGEPTAKVTI